MFNIRKFCFLILPVLLFSACDQQGVKQSGQAGGMPADTLKSIQRFGMVTGIKADKIDYYKQLHASIWPGVAKKIKACHIQNYSIYLKEIENKYYLFSYFEYTGNDFAKDMQLMAADSTTQRWWKETAPAQIPLPDAAAKNETWSRAEEVFFLK
ncbi:L-rhamnose mutarotase [Danxiaibacter flavus]|uniref:L-rhamnose mutarotase n=1 Tax=Danxiaibacter flavus TaxID=3049108 RepID=A0ABV3ZI86_9BACT|nr:L-rhamnose mutarotase [Chitinophagaceae bacterium DXS]